MLLYVSVAIILVERIMYSPAILLGALRRKWVYGRYIAVYAAQYGYAPVPVRKCAVKPGKCVRQRIPFRFRKLFAARLVRYSKASDKLSGHHRCKSVKLR